MWPPNLLLQATAGAIAFELIGNRFLRFGLKGHFQAPHTDSNGLFRFVYTDSCYLLIFSMDLEGMDCQI
jgi:hypothetical protein